MENWKIYLSVISATIITVPIFALHKKLYCSFAVLTITYILLFQFNKLGLSLNCNIGVMRQLIIRYMYYICIHLFFTYIVKYEKNVLFTSLKLMNKRVDLVITYYSKPAYIY